MFWMRNKKIKILLYTWFVFNSGSDVNEVPGMSMEVSFFSCVHSFANISHLFSGISF